MKFILAKKVNMTQVFTEDGKVVPVTVLHVEGSKISRLKTLEKDGYSAVQLQLGKKKKEFRVKADLPAAGLAEGGEIKVSDFEPGEMINLSAVSKGKGFMGAVKRHGFHGAPASHGHDHPRAVGSIGGRFPQHTRKGTRMAGRMGGAKATVKNSMVVAVDAEKNLLLVKGGVPGAPRSLVKVWTVGKKKELAKIVQYNNAAS